MVQVRAAIRAQPPAVALANDFEGQCQEHLLLDYVGQEESFSNVKSNFRVVVLQLVFLRLGVLGKRRVKQVEGAADVFDDRFEAARAHQFDLRFEVTLDANLRFQQLCRGGHFERFNQLDLRRMKIDAARGISLPDAQFADG